ncbi:MAG: OmpH family outer membrane protein [Paracoccaceae bacterium]|nr:OmpH family outer membrane protein [Paracoccaceae bacterium]
MALAAMLAGVATAQQSASPSPVLTIAQDRLFSGSAYGRALQDSIDAQSRALQAENRKIEADLEAEEQALTKRRNSLENAEFRALADAFDAKVEGIRAAQEAKARSLNNLRDQEQKRFFETAIPILAELMTDMGAMVILDKSAIVLSFDRIDVTDAAIARIDSILGDGDTLSDPVLPKNDTPPGVVPQGQP